MGYTEQIVLSTKAEAFIAQLATDLAMGAVESRQLSPALREFYWLSFWAGHATHNVECARQIENLNAENDRLYLRAWNKPAEVARILQRRIDGAFQESAALFFGDAS